MDNFFDSVDQLSRKNTVFDKVTCELKYARNYYSDFINALFPGINICT